MDKWEAKIREIFNGKWEEEFETCGLYYKCFTIINYDRNDSGQYYKTRITIVIDNPSLSLCQS